MEQSRDKNYLLYDGECPFCTSFSKFYALKKALPNIEIVSMRDAERLRTLSLPANLNFNDGMVLVLSDGRVLQGEPAFQRINGAVKKTSLRDYLIIGLNSIRAVTRIIYPIFFCLRLLVLKAKGVTSELPRIDINAADGTGTDSSARKLTETSP